MSPGLHVRGSHGAASDQVGVQLETDGEVTEYGFIDWVTLQHYDRFDGKHGPSLAVVDLEVPSVDPSDRSRLTARRTGVRGPLVVLATAVALFGLAACVPSSLDPNIRFDNRRFDDLEAAFEEDQASFEAAVARMEDLVVANPAADQIAWTFKDSCVTMPGETQECADTGIDDQQRFGALPNPSAIVYQAKDGQRIFIRFHMNDPPMYYLMYAPDDTNPGAFAESRGFRSHRELNDGWTILGPISDGQRYKDQWLLSD